MRQWAMPAHVRRTTTPAARVEVVQTGEVMLFVGDRFVVTVRYGELSPLAAVRKRLESNPEMLRHGELTPPPDPARAVADLRCGEREVRPRAEETRLDFDPVAGQNPAASGATSSGSNASKPANPVKSRARRAGRLPLSCPRAMTPAAPARSRAGWRDA